MKLGNPKHVIVLAIVAFGAIAFFLMRLMHGHGALASKAVAASSNSTRLPTLQGLPVEVLRDAFSHPALTKRYLASRPDPKEQPSTQDSDSTHPLPGALPNGVQEILPNMATASVASPKPSEIAGTARQEDGKAKSKITLKAIMRTATPLALVTINDRDDLAVGLGGAIDSTYRVTQFTQNAVLLTSRDDKEWLYVGHELTEK
ncbi:MAG: hypothetical protein ACYC96_05460 [Fimbriimonadaceae bacterium]